MSELWSPPSIRLVQPRSAPSEGVFSPGEASGPAPGPAPNEDPGGGSIAPANEAATPPEQAIRRRADTDGSHHVGLSPLPKIDGRCRRSCKRARRPQRPRRARRAECLDLLSSATVGRVGITMGALPMILPINFRLDLDRDLIRTTTGTKLDAATATPSSRSRSMTSTPPSTRGGV